MTGFTTAALPGGMSRRHFGELPAPCNGSCCNCAASAVPAASSPVRTGVRITHPGVALRLTDGSGEARGVVAALAAVKGADKRATLLQLCDLWRGLKVCHVTPILFYALHNRSFRHSLCHIITLTRAFSSKQCTNTILFLSYFAEIWHSSGKIYLGVAGGVCRGPMTG